MVLSPKIRQDKVPPCRLRRWGEAGMLGRVPWLAAGRKAKERGSKGAAKRKGVSRAGQDKSRVVRWRLAWPAGFDGRMRGYPGHGLLHGMVPHMGSTMRGRVGTQA